MDNEEQSTIVQEKITCSIQNKYNTWGLPKAIGFQDGTHIMVWCKYCRSMHTINPNLIQKVRQREVNTGIVTCSTIGERNEFGRAKEIAAVHQHSLDLWCKYCRCTHKVELAMLAPSEDALPLKS